MDQTRLNLTHFTMTMTGFVMLVWKLSDGLGTVAGRNESCGQGEEAGFVRRGTASLSHPGQGISA